MSKVKVETAEYWQFVYKKPPAPAMTGRIKASNERMAVLVAAKWCLLNNSRFIGGSVKPDVLADESILRLPDGPIDTEPSMDAMAATTAINEGK